jgi:hypothetical protein
VEKVCGLVKIGKKLYLNSKKLTDELSSQHRSPDSQWLVVTTLKTDGSYIPVLVNPFTCEVARLNINGTIEGWSP